MATMPLTRTLAVALVVAYAAPAAANISAFERLDHERHERSSFLPSISGLVGGQADGDTVGILGAHLRWRYGRSSPESRTRLFALALHAETTDLATFEPSASVGLQLLPTSCYCWGSPVWLNLRFDLGAGYRLGANDAGFVTARLGIGALFTERVKQTAWRGSVPYSYPFERLRAELDFVVKAQRDLDGGWLLAAGVEVDPVRIVQDVRRVLP